MDLMEILKTLFGGEALTFEQFAEKVNNAADVKLGNLAGGQYDKVAPKHSFFVSILYYLLQIQLLNDNVISIL